MQETLQLESSLMDEINVRLACMQKRHEVATGGIRFQREFAAESSERAVLEEVAATGWSVEGISLVGYLRASTETDLALLCVCRCCLLCIYTPPINRSFSDCRYLGSAVGAELTRRMADHCLADAQAARAACSNLIVINALDVLLLDVEQDTLTEEVTRADGGRVVAKATVAICIQIDEFCSSNDECDDHSG